MFLSNSNNDRQPNMAAETGSTYISGTIEIPNFLRQIWGFRRRRARRNCLRTTAKRSTTENGNIDVLGANLAISVVCRLRSYCLWNRHGRFFQIRSWKETHLTILLSKCLGAHDILCMRNDISSIPGLIQKLQTCRNMISYGFVWFHKEN